MFRADHGGDGKAWRLAENLAKCKRHFVVSNVDVVCHLNRIRELGIRLAANYETLYFLPLSAEVLLDPPHVTENLTHHLI